MYLVIEACKVKNSLSPVIINDVFQFTKILSLNLEVVVIFKEQMGQGIQEWTK